MGGCTDECTDKSLVYAGTLRADIMDSACGLVTEIEVQTHLTGRGKKAQKYLLKNPNLRILTETREVQGSMSEGVGPCQEAFLIDG